MSDKAYIYSLSDPSSGTVRYVGKTKSLIKREKQHVAAAREGNKTPLYEWIRSIGCAPQLDILEICDPSEWAISEQRWIASFDNLLNAHPGKGNSRLRDKGLPYHEKHGMCGTPEYNSWAAIVSRCTNPRSESYGNYGGRGITVCDDWRNSFSAFYADVGPRPSKDHSLDRIDPDGNYDPSNCRWSDRHDQSRNKRNNRWITHNGETRTISDWADLIGIRRSALRSRLKRHSVEVALSAPVGRPYLVPGKPNSNVRLLTFGDDTLTVAQWAKKLGIAHSTLRERITRHGPDIALSTNKVAFGQPLSGEKRNENRRRMITFNGETIPMGEWADRIGVKPSSLCSRIANMGLERALTQPRRRGKRESAQG